MSKVEVFEDESIAVLESANGIEMSVEKEGIRKVETVEIDSKEHEALKRADLRVVRFDTKDKKFMVWHSEPEQDNVQLRKENQNGMD